VTRQTPAASPCGSPTTAGYCGDDIEKFREPFAKSEGLHQLDVIELIESEAAPVLARPYFQGAQTSPIVASLAHVPEVLEVAMPFIGLVLGPSAIDARTKELVILRTSALLECEYCVASHTVVALDSGVAAFEARALRGGDVSAAFPDAREAALLHWVDAVAAGVGGVAPAPGAALAGHFSEPEIVELTLLCAATMMLNRYCTALRLATGHGTLSRLAAEGFA